MTTYFRHMVILAAGIVILAIPSAASAQIICSRNDQPRLSGNDVATFALPYFQGDRLVEAVAIAEGESGFGYRCESDNPRFGGPVTSVDYGLWQNNSKQSPAHPPCPQGSTLEELPATAAADFSCIVQNAQWDGGGGQEGFDISNFYRCRAGVSDLNPNTGTGLPAGTCTQMSVTDWQAAVDVATRAVCSLGQTSPNALVGLNRYACAPAPPPNGGGGTTIQPVSSLDPNEKAGSQGVGPRQYVSGVTSLLYTVQFSNQATATAPAQDVSITDQLDVSHDNLATVSFGPIGFGSQMVSPPPFQTSFATTVDLRPAENVLVAVKAQLNSSSGLLTWNFKSLDPATGLPPADPTAGFLPPGGEGSVFFTVMPKQSLATNTQIQNQATIVFDVNAPMSTQTWTNTIDNTSPTSQVGVLPAAEPLAGFTVTWSGTDIGAGIQDFTIYVTDNGGPFMPFQTNTTATSATFTGQVGHTYGFYSIARDLVGNMEAAKTAAEATTQVTTDTTPPVTIAAVSPGPNAAGWNNTNPTVTLNSTDNEQGGTGVKQITYGAIGAQTIASTNVSGSSTSFTISTEGITTITFFGTDNAGNIETAKTITIQLDKTPPTVACSASPNILWPPDNKLVPTNLSVNVSDALSRPGGFTLVSVTSNEPDSGQGDIQGFVSGSASTSGQLRATRLGSGTGRVYTFTYSGSDRAGNTASCSTTVSVPHDQGN